MRTTKICASCRESRATDQFEGTDTVCKACRLTDKECSTCHKRKSLSEFYADFSRSDRRQANCKACAVALNRERRRGQPAVRRSHKRCSSCEKVKSRDSFYAHCSNADGLQRICKACDKERAARRNHPEISKRRGRRVFCSKCAGLPHRVVGPECILCGLPRQEEAPVGLEDVQRSSAGLLSRAF